MEGKISIEKLMNVMSEILSDRYALDITLTVRAKERVACCASDNQGIRGGIQ